LGAVGWAGWKATSHFLGLGGGNAAKAAAGGATAGGEVGGAAGAVGLGFIMRRLGILGAVIGLTETLDPKGNFGGVTAPVDNWFKEHLGFDPSNIPLPSFAGGGAQAASKPWGSTDRQTELRQAYARQADMHPVIRGERDMEAARARALSNLPPPKVNLKTNVTLENHLKVTIDGRDIAAKIEAEIVRKYEHSTVAPASDTHASYVDPDYGFATG
jgi:hypothetical protein